MGSMSDNSESSDGAISAMLIIFFTFYLLNLAYFVRLGYAKYFLIYLGLYLVLGEDILVLIRNS